MLKKLIVGGIVAGVLVAGLAWAGGPFRYARTWVASLWKNAEDSVPMDIKIKNAREEVTKLGPKIRDFMHVIAEQQVDIERLQENVADRKRELMTQQAAIQKLRDDLKRGDTTYVYAGRDYSASEVRQDLALRFERYLVLEDAVKRDEKILTAKKKALKANEQRLEGMLASKKKLEIQVEQLEARWKTLQAAESTSEVEFDDSELAETKKLIRKIDKELEVRSKLLASRGKISGNIPVDAKPSKIPVTDVTQKIDDYFGKRNGATVAAKKPAGAGL